jgi:hypothetical protein
MEHQLPIEVTIKDYLALLAENLKLKEEAKEINPWMRWVHFAHMIDSFRLFPRLFFGVYILLLGFSGYWFMMLPAPLVAQSAFISTMVGAGAAWFGLYVNSGWKHNTKG